ncbi:hypothetical protein LUZ60_002088 [Juncus effusus]|nr:hypothetical protein LUZ60_002088 [Juncus effusus]
MARNGHSSNGYTEPVNPSYYSDDDDDAPLVFRRPQNIIQNPNPNSIKRPSSLASQNNPNQRPKLSTSNPNSVSKSNTAGSVSRRESEPNPKPNLKPCQSSATRNPSNERPNSNSKLSLNSSVRPNPNPNSNSSIRPNPNSNSHSSVRPNPNSNSSVRPNPNPNSSVRPNPNSNSNSKPASSVRPNPNLNSNKTVSNSNLNLAKKENLSSDDDSTDELPLSQRLKNSKTPPNSVKNEQTKPKTEIETKKRQHESSTSKENNHDLKKPKITPLKREREIKSESDSDDFVPLAKRAKEVSSSKSQIVKKQTVQITKKPLKNSKLEKSSKNKAPGSGGGKKWSTLVHNGVIFPPPYKSHGVKMLYDGKLVDLTEEQEEVATMFAVMMETDYAKKPKFIENFMHDWGKILGKNHVIKKFELCDFTPIYEWHEREKEKKKQMTSEEKKALKEEKLKQEEKYMYALVDGVKEKVGNFRVEPPGLFRGRGEHPKMGKLKKRIRPSDITINIGKGAPIPECPIPGERWKEVKHDNTVTWLAFWNDPISTKDIKYVFLAASSSLKGESDRQKYEKARLLKEYIHKIRENYTRDFNSKDSIRRQTAVATYLIDKLALRAGNDKDDDEADTVGCCTLKVENVVCVPPNKLQFDFLGKDSIRYFNTVEVELPVYKAIEDFRTSKNRDGRRKKEGDDLFDMIDTTVLNTHLKSLMPNLTAKVFRTYNASITLDQILNKETEEGTVAEKIAVYQRANKEVAIICNHQRTVSKSHDSQMGRLNEKIDELKAEREELEEDLSRAKKGKSPLKDKDGKTKRNLSPESIEKKIAQIDARIEKMELDKKVKEDLKTVALGTSKVNYLDPRISVAWCKRHEVPIEKIFNKSLLAKFAWAMDVDPDYRF